MRDRLIELLNEATFGVNVHTLADHLKKETIEAVADHLLANGVVVPPCKVSTKIYFAGLDSGECLSGELMSFCLDAAHLWFNCKYDCGLNYWHPIEDFETRVFLTREEAEQALKGGGEG